MSSEEFFNAVLAEAARIANGETKYSESWVSKLGVEDEQGIYTEACKDSARA